MSDLLTHDDEGVDDTGPNDIEYITDVTWSTERGFYHRGFIPFNNESVLYWRTTRVSSDLEHTISLKYRGIFAPKFQGWSSSGLIPGCQSLDPLGLFEKEYQ